VPPQNMEREGRRRKQTFLGLQRFSPDLIALIMTCPILLFLTTCVFAQQLSVGNFSGAKYLDAGSAATSSDFSSPTPKLGVRVVGSHSSRGASRRSAGRSVKADGESSNAIVVVTVTDGTAAAALDGQTQNGHQGACVCVCACITFLPLPSQPCRRRRV